MVHECEGYLCQTHGSLQYKNECNQHSEKDSSTWAFRVVSVSAESKSGISPKRSTITSLGVPPNKFVYPTTGVCQVTD